MHPRIALALTSLLAPTHAHAQTPAPVPVHAPPPPLQPSPRPITHPEPIRGTGLLISGGVLLGLGVPLLIIGLASSSDACWSVGGSCDEPDMNRNHGAAGFIAAGLVGTLGGGTLLIVGGVKRSEWREWQAKQRTLTPAITRTTTGTWLPGLTLRF